jgi:adenine-specific DNA-methyltransferase
MISSLPEPAMREEIPSSSTVFTPEILAAAMVGAAGGGPGLAWLDPCVGDGAFIAAMSQAGVPSDRIRALDISPAPAQRDSLARTERGVDFVDWAVRHPASVDCIVMNPPYVALNRLRGAPLARSLQLELSSGQRLPLRANYWCAFILCGIRCLLPSGTLVAVLPAAWEFAQYAASVREEVYGAFGDVTVIRCMKPLFPTVQEGAVVVVARRRGATPMTLRHVTTPDLQGTVAALREVAGHRIPQGTAMVRRLATAAERQTRLGDLLYIRIGAVTGDARYFLLTEQERLTLGLPRAAVRPVVSRSRHLTAAVMTQQEWERLRDQGERVWLFRPSNATLSHPAVDRYLQQGQEGACSVTGFKVRSRDPWHQTPLPGRIDGFLSGMSKRLPFLSLRGMDRLTATNTLYVVRFTRAREAADRAAIGLALLTSKVRRELARHVRVYADGLVKFEPTELSRVLMPSLSPRPDAVDVFERATALLLAEDEPAAEALADEWAAEAETSGLAPVNRRILR